MSEKRIDQNNVVVWNENGINTSAWVWGGAKGWFLTKAEKSLPPQELHRLIVEKWNEGKGVWRCTGCGLEMKESEVAGWPLFAGVACANCMKKHNKELDNERRNGHICRFCGEPYGNCCC